MDYAGPFQGFHFFVVVDAKSKWAEIKPIKQAPTSENTIHLLQEIFCTHGLPKVLVSDNASIFQSTMFHEFCTRNGIIQKFTAPGHPSTNGLAERNIQTLKRKLTAMAEEKLSMHVKIREILFRYRATPLQCGKTPAQLYLGRDIRIKLDAMRPPKESVGNKIFHHNIRNYSVGERVQARWYADNKPTWKFGTIEQKFGRLHYQIKLDNGYSLKRHIDQLARTSVPPKKTMTFQDDRQESITDKQ
ncbi:uncharacterized protein K02A2.6-like isoform X2 [Photinus pyralis]|uniref:uncharacterized protein K02A2.6-like isoform X1 n=1 Tax=Photinus pyralis TaxID=7054 RepID=UPI0012672655|nr:uncharacterized protein K02A2.6-like isoform X1 [Photinus pyralis]XP_031359495.1 uncharacterized protein K02A2.6-like isoform X2 [Photinus pyralis]